MQGQLLAVLDGGQLNIDDDLVDDELIEVLHVAVVVLPLLLLAHLILPVFESVLVEAGIVLPVVDLHTTAFHIQHLEPVQHHSLGVCGQEHCQGWVVFRIGNDVELLVYQHSADAQGDLEAVVAGEQLGVHALVVAVQGEGGVELVGLALLADPQGKLVLVGVQHPGQLVHEQQVVDVGVAGDLVVALLLLLGEVEGAVELVLQTSAVGVLGRHPLPELLVQPVGEVLLG